MMKRRRTLCCETHVRRVCAFYITYTSNCETELTSLARPAVSDTPKGRCCVLYLVMMMMMMLLSFIFFLTVLLETSKPISECTGPIFAIFSGYVYRWHDQSDVLFAIAQGTLLYGKQFWRESAKWRHSVSWHSITDERITTRMHALTPLAICLRQLRIW